MKRKKKHTKKNKKTGTRPIYSRQYGNGIMNCVWLCSCNSLLWCFRSLLLVIVNISRKTFPARSYISFINQSFQHFNIHTEMQKISAFELWCRNLHSWNAGDFRKGVGGWGGARKTSKSITYFVAPPWCLMTGRMIFWRWEGFFSIAFYQSYLHRKPHRET